MCLYLLLDRGEIRMKKMAVLLIVLGLMVAVAPAVFAEDGTTTGDITINGTAATIDTYPLVMETVSLDGVDTTVILDDPLAHSTAGPTHINQSWLVRDPRGNGGGWSVNISVTDFIGTSGVADDKDKIIPLIGVDAHSGQHSFYMRLVDDVSNGGIDWIDGQCNSSNPDSGDPLDQCVEDATADLLPNTLAGFKDFTTPLVNDMAHPLTFISADADKGMGSYYLEPEFQLFVPAETYAGGYQSTLTITLVPVDL
jgi:hypothetical protein